MWWNKKEEEPKRKYIQIQVEIKLYSNEEPWIYVNGGYEDEDFKSTPEYKYQEKEIERLLKWWETPEKGDYFVLKGYRGNSFSFERENVEHIWKKSSTVFLS